MAQPSHSKSENVRAIFFRLREAMAVKRKERIALVRQFAKQVKAARVEKARTNLGDL